MTSPLLSVADLKTWLGLTGSSDDTLLGTCIDDAVSQAEADTSRVFAASSNVTTRYSTNGDASLVIHDRPYTDPSRTVVLNGVTLTQDSTYWMLPDRRNQNISTVIQVRYYDPLGYRADPNWWDRNLDNWPRAYSFGAQPNDLVISGIIGQPFPTQDVISAIRLLSAWHYYRAKSGASGTVTTPTGEVIELSDVPARYKDFVLGWRIVTAVAAV